MSDQAPDWRDPTDPTVVEESHTTLTELLALSASERLQSLGAALRDGRLEVAPDVDDRFGLTVSVKICVPTTFGRFAPSAEEEDLLLECLRGAVHAGDAWVGSCRIVYVPSRQAWNSRKVRPLPDGLIGGRYQIMGSIGRGGFAEVFEADDRFMGTRVAVKVLHEQPSAVEQSQALDRMRREMRVLHETSHPNVISILNFGQLEDGRLWYVMPLAGGSLKERIPTMDRNVSSLLAVMEDIAAGLDHLAGNGVVHRDLTPANVLYLDGRWVVADLGLVVDTSRESEVLTGTGWGVGTERYAPPERLTARDATPAWDIYSFGELCIDLITGSEAKDRVLGEIPAHVFSPAIRRACSHSPLDRFGRASHFVEECRRLHQIEINADWESPTDRSERLRAELRDRTSRAPAFDEVVLIVSSDPALVGAYTSALGSLRAEEVADLAHSRPGGFRIVFDAVASELPDSWTQFAALDAIGEFMSACADLPDDYYPTTALRWLAEVGADWDRWHLQGLAASVVRRLRDGRVHVIRPALEGLSAAATAHAVPDPSVLPPDARPVPSSEPGSTLVDDDPF